jgi:hypothetical protein
MATPTWVTLANANGTSQTTTGTALANSTTITDISSGANSPGQAFQTQPEQLYPGQMLRFTAAGIYSTAGTPTLLLGVYYGGVAGVALAATAATASASGVANGIWTMSALARVLSTGTAGTIATLGSVLGIAATSANPVLMPATSATGNTVTIDTSIAKLITVGAQWGTASASNTITCYQWAIEYLTEP